MGLFNLFKKKQDTVTLPQTTNKPVGNFDNMVLYEHIVSIDCFDVHYKRYSDLQIKQGDVLNICFEPSAINNNIDAVVVCNNVKIGYLPYKEGKWLRLLFKNKNNTCIVDKLNVGEKCELFVKINLPYKNNDNNLPLQVKLVGVTFEDRQQQLSQSLIGDYVNVKHEPTTDYPNTLKVYNVRLNKCIGVIPDATATKYIKKYKQGCVFNGVILSLFGGNYSQNIGVDIIIFDKI